MKKRKNILEEKNTLTENIALNKRELVVTFIVDRLILPHVGETELATPYDEEDYDPVDV